MVLQREAGEATLRDRDKIPEKKAHNYEEIHVVKTENTHVREHPQHQRDALGPGTLRCRTSTWTNVVSSYRYQETRGTKSNCLHVQLGQIVDKRYKKTKNPTATSKVSGAKAGPGSHPLHTIARKGWADHPGHLSGPTPGPAAALTHLRNQLARLPRKRAGHPLLVLPPSTAARVPIQPCLNFSPDLSSIPTDGHGRASGWSQKEQVGHKGQ